VALLADAANRDRSAGVRAVIPAATVADMCRLADEVHVDATVLGYISSMAEETRRHPQVRLGVSVRGCLAYVRCAKAWAAADGRGHVSPDDVKALAFPVLGHRILLDPEAEFGGATVEGVIEAVLETIAPPQERAA
jgi:MoxR-like ATPase